jgi:GTP pyrophosphokinase
MTLPTMTDVAEVMDRFNAEPAPAPADRHDRFLVLGLRFNHALFYVGAAHRQQPRKGTPVPYLAHLLGVASIVLTYEGTEDQAIAGLLHDIVEDCGPEHEPVIKELFGTEVLRMVLACTDSRVAAGEEKADWRPRKEAYIAHLRALPPNDPALLVSCADKLHNAQAILADLEAHGLALWSRFKGKTPEDHLWYYGELAATFEAHLEGALPARLQATVDAIRDTHQRLSSES